MAKQVIQLNNKYTQKHKKRNLNPVPKRKHLGLILIVAILLFSLASMSLIKSYETLHSQVALEQSAKKQYESLSKKKKYQNFRILTISKNLLGVTVKNIHKVMKKFLLLTVP